jgi:hypothetical protein
MRTYIDCSSKIGDSSTGSAANSHCSRRPNWELSGAGDRHPSSVLECVYTGLHRYTIRTRAMLSTERPLLRSSDRERRTGLTRGPVFRLTFEKAKRDISAGFSAGFRLLSAMFRTSVPIICSRSP